MSGKPAQRRKSWPFDQKWGGICASPCATCAPSRQGGRSMSFQYCGACRPNNSKPLSTLSDAELARTRRSAADRRGARTGLSLPRQPHRFRSPGDELILVNYEHHDVASPYRMRFAVFVRKGDETFERRRRRAGAIAQADACGARVRRRRHDGRLRADRRRDAGRCDRTAIRERARGLSARPFRRARLSTPPASSGRES